MQEPDHRRLALLRPRREGPCGCRAAEKRDERAPLHSITSSARASIVGGISRPSALAVFRLITRDRKSTRLNSSHGSISYAVFCLKRKKRPEKNQCQPPHRTK